jgi:hypothetical protein
MKKKTLFIVLLIAITIILGFLRDYVFVSINHIIETGNGTNGHLLILKWILTGFCSILYLGITCFFLFLLFRSQKYIRIAISIYVLIFAIAFLIGGIGYITVSFGKVYLLVRAILGIAQSPIVMMILIPACFINEQNSLDKKS